MSGKKKKKLSQVMKEASVVTIISSGAIMALLLIALFVFFLPGRINYYKIEPRVEQLENAKKTSGSDYETKGWLRIQGTNIDFPIIFKNNDDYTYPVEMESYAWLYDKTPQYDKKVNIMGHNIFNLSSKPEISSDMFHRMEELMAFVYEDFASKNKYIQYTVDGKDYLYKIFSAGFVEKADIATIPYLENTSEDMKNQIKLFKDVSFYDYDVDVNEDDYLITVLTCTEFFPGKEGIDFQVTARRVRDGEKVSNYDMKANKQYEDIKKKLEKGDDENENESV